MAGGRGASGAINKPVNTSRATNRRGGGTSKRGVDDDIIKQREGER